MQEINLNSWEQFEEQLQELEKKRQEQKSLHEFLYRGQGRKSWELSTTLERHGKKNLSLMQYFRLISVVKPQIESFTRVNWNILSYPEGFENWLTKNNTFLPHALSCSKF